MNSYLEKLEEYNHQLVLENKRLARACNACNISEETGTEAAADGAEAAVAPGALDKAKNFVSTPGGAAVAGGALGAAAGAALSKKGKRGKGALIGGALGAAAGAGVAHALGEEELVVTECPGSDGGQAGQNADNAVVAEDGEMEQLGNDGEVKDKPVASNIVVVEDDDDEEEDEPIDVADDDDEADGDTDDTVDIVDTSVDGDGDDSVEVTDSGDDEDADIDVTDDDTIDVVDGDEEDEFDATVVDDDAAGVENIEDATPITDDVKQQIIDLGVDTMESDCRFSIHFENEEDPNFTEVLKILADAGITGAVAITDFGTYIAVAKECPEDDEGGAEDIEDDSIEVDDEIDSDEDDEADAEDAGDDAVEVSDVEPTDDDEDEDDDSIEVVDGEVNEELERTKTGAKIGALTGAVVGGLGGGTVGAMIGGPGGAALGGVGGAVAGAAKGGMLGAGVGLAGDALLGDKKKKEEENVEESKKKLREGAILGGLIGGVAGQFLGSKIPGGVGEWAGKEAFNVGGVGINNGALAGAGLGALAGAAMDREDESLQVREARAAKRIRENVLMAKKDFMKKEDKPIPESIQRMVKTNKKLFAGK